MGWEEAGHAWGLRAVDWAYLMEPVFGPVYDALATALDLEPGAELLDVGCGAGLAMTRYAARGARVSGIDAAAGLLAIAAARVPEGDLRHGSMMQLPWPDATFSHVTGVNSFVYADDGALAEASRVLEPGGLLGLGYWSDPVDFGWAMGALGKALEPHLGVDGSRTPLRLADAGAAARLLSDAGFRVERSGTVAGMSEFADPEIAYRALASTGMIAPLVESGEEAVLRRESLATLESIVTPESGVRMAAEFGWVVARRL